ncbi:MAG: hypothetical protein E5V46_03320 [Mesorhizobium sp.]|nr:MAG: hypothetical protein E5V46_03320 [Mesorhizobium sp.]
MLTMSKADFARHIGVTRGRVSQYVAEGTIGPDALDGQGRTARVIVAKAIEQIRQRRDIGQALGNGLSTRLDPPAEPAGTVTPFPGGAGADGERKQPTIDDEIKAERLQAERRRNRLAAVEEAMRQGQLVEAASAMAAMKKEIKALDDAFGGMLADLATAVSAQFGLPQRDVLHLLRRIRSEKKAALAERARRRAESLPERVSMIVEGNDADGVVEGSTSSSG